MIDNIDKEIIKIIQDNIPISLTPFKDIGKKLSISEEEVIFRINKMIENNVIRRFGAVLKHQKAGIIANGMIVWNVPDELAEEIGYKLAQFKEVTHCYERPRQKNWPYNIFTMVHGRTKEDCIEIAKKLSKEVGIENYDILFSLKEFKKSSMKYFIE
jgi:DNA-binding Lrp family transcriptional regulator